MQPFNIPYKCPAQSNSDRGRDFELNTRAGASGVEPAPDVDPADRTVYLTRHINLGASLVGSGGVKE